MPTLAEVLDFIKAAKKGAATKISDLINQEPQQLSMEGRANFLPYQDTLPGSVMNQRSWALNGIAAGGINAITAPRRAMQGGYEADEDGNITPTFNAPEEAMNVAGNVMGGGMGASRVAPAPAGSLGMNAIKKGSQEITSLVQQRNNPNSIISGIGDDLITLYHGTSKSAAEKIKNEGVIKSGSYFGNINGVSLTPRKSVAEDFANGGEIIEVKVPKSKLVVDPESVDNLNLDQAIKDGKSLYATGSIYFPAPNRNK